MDRDYYYSDRAWRLEQKRYEEREFQQHLAYSINTDCAADEDGVEDEPSPTSSKGDRRLLLLS